MTPDAEDIGKTMTPAEFRALLEKASERPWQWEAGDAGIDSAKGGCVCHIQHHGNVRTVEATGEEFSSADARAIVATMNRAELFAELWNFVRAVANYNNFSNRADYEEACEILAKLEAAP